MSNAIDILNQVQGSLEEKKEIYLKYELNEKDKVLTIRNSDTFEERPTDYKYYFTEKVILDCVLPSDCSDMFAFYGKLKEVACTERFDSSHVTSMSEMFSCCKHLQKLDVSDWDVSNVENMYGMFMGCQRLQHLDISRWNVSRVTNMSLMFSCCQFLQQVDVSNWDVSNVKFAKLMFDSCSKLRKLDVSKWDVSDVDNMNNMFVGCVSLSQKDLPEWALQNGCW